MSEKSTCYVLFKKIFNKIISLRWRVKEMAKLDSGGLVIHDTAILYLLLWFKEADS
jgi:hypothetical protein